MRGDPHRLGVHLAGDGVDVAVLASHAQAIDLCLLDPDPSAPHGWRERRIPLHGPDYGVWHAHVPGVRVGQRYGFRAHGTWDSRAGLRHNPDKLLVDPYARGLAGQVRHAPEIYGHVVGPDGVGGADGPHLPRDTRDSIAHVPHGTVVDDAFDWGGTSRPRVPWSDTVIYEAHVRGLTRTLPDVPEELRGTYAGAAHPATIAHLRDLGVTTLELQPIHAFADEPHLVRKGLTNYWGYNTLGFFAPHPAYATEAARQSGPQAVLDEVKGMVKLLHEAGIEVLLDVVYNHTCEGGDDGPHLSWRGLDNTRYYLHDGGLPATLVDVTGCGNTLNFREARVVQMALDSLRYWAEQVHVDGFRFDLAVTLARDEYGFTSNHPFLVALTTDPVLRDRKLVAEPWDVGPDGWRTGQFPMPMAEWNDRFRDAVRTFWLVDAAEAAHGRPGHGLQELATRLAGSADLFGHGSPPLARRPAASINFVTAHDGFTLADLVTYSHKHNAANGEDNRDGTDDNRSWNHGVEGPAPPGPLGEEVEAARRRSMRNLLGTLLVAAGTPMITAGDEIGRTQRGNNNAYCQDNEVSWLDWDLEPGQEDLRATTRHLLTLRREHPVLRGREFYLGRPRVPGGRPDLAWFDAEGLPMEIADWHETWRRVLQMLRAGGPGERDALVVINGAIEPVEVRLADDVETTWELVWDSVWESPHGASAEDPAGLATNGDPVVVEPLSLRLYLSR